MSLTTTGTVRDDRPKMLSLREAAAFLGVHPNTVRAQVRQGIIPGSKVGRDWRFLHDDLVAWIRSGYREAARVQLSALEREAIWHSTDVQADTMSSSQRRTEQALDDLLERPTGRRPKNITTD